MMLALVKNKNIMMSLWLIVENINLLEWKIKKSIIILTNLKYDIEIFEIKHCLYVALKI